MSIAANKVIVHQYLDAWGRGDLGALRALLAEDCLTHNPGRQDERSIEFEVEACAIWHRSFAAVELRIEQLVAESDQVAARWVLEGQHSAEFVGIPPTGKRVSIEGFEISRVADGKIVEIWRLSDTMGLMQQLGAM